MRKGGFAVARLEHGRLADSKVGQRHVQGRTKAGGQSQQRFARRRDNQARAAYEAAADHCARILGGALALVVTGRNGGYGALGAQVWIVARILYVPLYLFHIPFARSLAWFVSIFALVAMLIRLFE